MLTPLFDMLSRESRESVLRCITTSLPHTSLLSLTERFTRRDLNTLHYEVTVNDPGAYTRPWTSSWDLQWVPGEELFESYCQDNRP